MILWVGIGHVVDLFSRRIVECRIFDENGLSGPAMAVDVFPGIGSGKGELVRTHANDFTILLVKANDPVNDISLNGMIDMG